LAFSGAWNYTFLAVSGPWNQEKPFWSFQGPEMTICWRFQEEPFWSFQGPEMTICWRFQGPEKTPYWLFQAPEIRKSLFGVFRGLKWPYVGAFRGPKRHLIGWKRWYYGSYLLTQKRLSQTNQGVFKYYLSTFFLWVGGLALQQLSKGRFSKETIVQGTAV